MRKRCLFEKKIPPGSMRMRGVEFARRRKRKIERNRNEDVRSVKSEMQSGKQCWFLLCKKQVWVCAIVFFLFLSEVVKTPVPRTSSKLIHRHPTFYYTNFEKRLIPHFSGV